MKFVELSLHNFGKFTDFTINFSPHFTLITGPNEAGKTTSAEAVIGILFGFRRGLKHLRDRYRPRQGEKYAASLLLAAEEDRRYLVGRDFEHDRLEIFSGTGMRFESLPEHLLSQILKDLLGTESAAVFEAAFFLRPPTRASLRRERLVLGEALGLIKQEENAPHGLGKEEDRAGPANQEESSSALLAERERLLRLLAELEEEERALAIRKAAALAYRRRQEERENLINQLEEINRQLAEAADPAKTEEIGALERDCKRAEELADQIALLEVELRYEEEGLREYEAELELLEREIALVRAKLATFDQAVLDPEIQAQVNRVVPVINEHSIRLGELFPQLDRATERLRRSRYYFYGFWGLGLAAVGINLGFYGFLTPLYRYLLTGGGIISWWGAFAVCLRAYRLRRRVKGLTAEIEKRETELKARRAEVEELLQGKTIVQYQTELEAKRLYENDLWHLEQTLAQKKGKNPQERLAEIKKNLAAAKEELATILAARAVGGLAEMREKTAALRQERASSLEVLRAREEAIRRRLEELPSAEEEVADMASLTAAEEELKTRQAEIRRRLAAIENGAADREGEGGILLSSSPRQDAEISPAEPATAAGLAGRLGEILAGLSGGRYREVRVTVDPEGLMLKVLDPVIGEWLAPEDLSAGSLAQFRLAFQVAAAEKLAPGLNPPFLLDDPFVEMDEERLRLTVAFLARLCRSRQIVWFTRRGEAVRRWLEEEGVEPEVIELTP